MWILNLVNNYNISCKIIVEELNNMRMIDKPIESRPYEKFDKYGVLALSNIDLLAIILRNGTHNCSAEDIAFRLLTFRNTKPNNSEKETSLLELCQLSYNELLQVEGIGKIKAMQILSLIELTKRISKESYNPKGKITSPGILANYFMEQLRHEREEQFIVVSLNAKCEMVSEDIVSIGSLTASIVHPREVYKIAIKRSAHSIIAIHNHPSGDPSPSKEDISITKRLKESGELMGVPLLDHIVIGDGIYKSFKEESYL